MHDDVVEKLIAAQCNVNIPVTAGCTALSLATQNGHTRIVTMIHNCLHPCTICKKYGHDATGCWINAENKLKRCNLGDFLLTIAWNVEEWEYSPNSMEAWSANFADLL